MERPAWAPQGIDLTVPSVSRMYDYYLGGSHNFEVDREAARQAIDAWPTLPKLMQANRAFMRRALGHAAEQGVDQFLDIGSGIPTFGNVHEIAQRANPEARVVYVDCDPVAVAHSRAVLEGNTRAGVVPADFRAPTDILRHETTERLLDFNRPVALMLVAILHFIEDREDPWKSVTEIRDALAPGSLLILSHGSWTAALGNGGGEAEVEEVYHRFGQALVSRDKASVERFFDGFALVEPGVVSLPHWRPTTDPDQEDPAAFFAYAGVGRKVGSVG
ncbi:SAM-dependent methyltransferase [Streptomyces sp. NPDC005438]|uniref:SAM-dependent methyltransferase n=1 Tax=Streptomyces sp. NPDC005438 TaxID=3156880 RepID=UPI0033BDBE3B